MSSDELDPGSGQTAPDGDPEPRLLTADLERLRAATDAITPDERIGDAMMEAVKGAAPAGDPLAAIALATASIDAAPEIGDAIMGRIASVQIAPKDSPHARAAGRDRAHGAPASWTDGVRRAGPVAVGLALVAAAASFLFFLSSQREVDDAVVSSVDSVEVLE